MKPESIQTYANFLESRGYAPQTIHNYSMALVDFPDLKNTSDPYKIYQHINEYLATKDHQLTPYIKHNVSAATSQLFLMFTGVSYSDFKKETLQCQSPSNQLLDDFYRYSTEFKHLTAMSAKAEVHHISVFLQSLTMIPDDWAKLTAYDISKYVSSAFQGLKASSVGRYVTSLRNFFRFLEYKGYTINESVLNLPLTSADWAKSMVPVTLTAEEENKLRFHYKSDSKNGVRNNLIVRLMLDLGLRCSELPDLVLDDIKWSRGVLCVQNTKNKVSRELPISNEIGHLLEEYIMHHRPVVQNERHLFLKQQLTNILPMTRENVRGVIRRALSKEDITGWWKGTHALRRTAASRLYNNGNGLKVVADILGHESIDSTKAYIKVDFYQLSLAATPWPGGDSNE